MSLTGNPSWEQLFDTPTANIPHDSQEHDIQSSYKYVDRTDRAYRKPPAHFSISITRIDGDSHKTMCHPGSILEGVVKVKLDTPLAAHHLKIVYRGIETFYDYNSLLNSPKKKKGDTFFSIQTHLWGKHTTTTATGSEDNTWPLLEAGDHQFPFMCDMPMINFPPSIQHTLVSCDFEMIASLERPGIRPFHTIPIAIQYEPLVLSTKAKSPDSYQQTLTIDSSTQLALCLPKGCDYQLVHRTQVPIELDVEGDIKSIQICLKRKLTTYRSSEVEVMMLTKLIADEKRRHVVYLDILKDSRMLASVNKALSKSIQIEYQLEFRATIKHSMWSKSKAQCSIPLHFGTTFPGEQLPFHLTHYYNTQNANPKFIKVPHELWYLLPSYHEDTSPPIYIMRKK